MKYYTQKQIDNNRRKWLSQLRDPESKKETGQLESLDDSNTRCCLGHACHALGIKRLVESYAHEQEKVVTYDFQNTNLPYSACNMLNINVLGEFKKEVLVNGKYCQSLTEINDFTDLTPKEIADLIEEQFKENNLEEAYKDE